MTQKSPLANEKGARVAHLFNPEHDLALASGQERFTSPAAGRGMRADLAFLPALWASDGDIVLVDDVDRTLELAMRHDEFLADVEYVALKDVRKHLGRAHDEVEVRPWGWNKALRLQLLKAGIEEDCLPSLQQLDRVRDLSHRATTIPLLHGLLDSVEGLVGERVEVRSIDELHGIASLWPRFVVKAPWSSSGRGVRFVSQWPQSNLEGFVRNVILRQGSVVVEPLYEKETDFAMEFMADGKGNAEYLGLSLFHTVNGAYVGNLLAPEEEKRSLLAHEITLTELDRVAQQLAMTVGEWCKDCYRGPFGVDMMLVRSPQGYALHPCVEVNLRRTMGHVALAATRCTRGRFRVMTIRCENGIYQLRFEE